MGRPPGVKNKTGNTKVDEMNKIARERQKAIKTLTTMKNSYCIAQNSPKCRENQGFRKATEFYASRSKLFGSDKCPICKDCLNSMLTMNDGTVDRVKLMKILPIIDRPYLEEDFNKAIENYFSDENGKKASIIGEYMRLIGSPSKINLGFDDSDATIEEVERQVIEELDPSDMVVTKELKFKWGVKTDEEVRILQSRYNEYVHYYSVKEDDPVQTSLIRDICFQDLKLHKARQEGLSEKDIIATKRDLLNTSNLTPAQTAKTSAGFSIGAFVKHLEEDRPILAPSEEYKDVDNIKRVFMTFFTHILSMMGVGNRGN